MNGEPGALRSFFYRLSSPEILTEISRTGCRVQEVPADVSYTAYSLAKGQRLIDAATILWDLAISRLR